MVEVASHALDVGAVPTSGGASTHLQLTASVETVIGLDGTSGGELEFAGVVPAATVQRLACDARIRRVLLGPNSAVIDVGRALRLPSAAARAACVCVPVAAIGRDATAQWRSPTRITWCTGATAAPQTWTTWSCCATATTGWSMRAAGS